MQLVFTGKELQFSRREKKKKFCLKKMICTGKSIDTNWRHDILKKAM